MRFTTRKAGALVAVLLGGGAAGAIAQTVPTHIRVTESVYVFRTYNYGRAVSVFLKTNAILQVNAEVLRSGTVLGQKTEVVPAGASHDVVVGIPRSVAAGPAKLSVKLTDEQKRSQTFTQTVDLPTPKRVPYGKARRARP